MQKWTKIVLTTVMLLAVMFLLPPGTNSADAATPTSGTWGDLSWTLDSSGTLTISGRGEMKDLTTEGYMGLPIISSDAWRAYTDQIITVVIQEGVTSIGVNAFSDCKSMTGVTIPESVTSIGNNAFVHCDSLKSVIIPSEVTRIGMSAFSQCGCLTSVSLSSGLEFIGVDAFKNCTSLSSIVIPDTVTTIGSSAFSYCSSLTDLTLSSRLTSIEFGTFWQCSALKSISVPSGVTDIIGYAFYHSGVTSISIPSSVKNIYDDAFYECENLTDVYYGGTQLQWNAINIGLHNDLLTSANIHYTGAASGTWGDLSWTLDSSGTLTISGRGEMKDLTTEGYMGLPIISSDAWRAYTDQIITVVIQEGVTSIGVNAFSDCKSMTGVTIPESVTSIGNNAFVHCDSLKSVIIPSEVTRIGMSAFSQCGCLTSVSLSSGLEFIGVDAFKNCTSLSSIVIPDTVTTIGSSAFSYCSSLTDVTLPSRITDIPIAMFQGCIALKSISVPSGVTTIGEIAFNHTGLKSISIPSSVQNIGQSAFYACEDLTDVYYEGTQSQWNAINIGLDNASLTSANIHYTGATQSYSVSYHANGGMDAPAAQTKTQDVALTLSSTKPTRASASAGSYTVTLNANGGSVSPTSMSTARTTSYTFKNWNTKQDGSGTSYNSGGSYTANEDATLYAQWNSSTVTAAVTLPTPSRSGYTFQGWSTSSSASSGTKGNYTPTGNVTLYATWSGNSTASYTVSYNANGGTGTPSSQTKEQNVSLTLSSIKPSKSYVIQYNANGGSVSPASKNVACTFRSWNTKQDGSGTSYAPGGTYTSNSDVTLYAQWTNPTAGTLATPSRSGYTFAGWFSSAAGGEQIKDSSTVTGNMTVYAHWSAPVVADPYNMGDETYSFANYSDSDSPGGHCFGMSMTSAGYHNGFLDIGKIGGNANTPLYSFGPTQIVKRPICYYQGIQGWRSTNATVAGGSYYLYHHNNMALDWQEVVGYVRNHDYDGTGLLQIGFRKDGEGGHAINFLRYESVNGQDRIYAYDNNFPTQETYFYRDSSGSVRQTPVQTFSGAIDCIALRDIRTYFNTVGDFDVSHVLYMPKDAAAVQGYSYSYMDGDFEAEEYVMYEIPADQSRVIIVPNRDYADFIYMDTEYSFGKITDDTRGELKLATMNEGAVVSEASFRIFEADSVFGEPDFALPSALKEIDSSAFEGIAATTVYVPDSCVSIGAYAFRNAAITQIRIPAQCSIADTAFDGCAKVTIFGTPGSPAEAFCNSHKNCTFVTENG